MADVDPNRNEKSSTGAPQLQQECILNEFLMGMRRPRRVEKHSITQSTAAGAPQLQ
jgi:hypothetical protein